MGSIRFLAVRNYFTGLLLALFFICLNIISTTSHAADSNKRHASPIRLGIFPIVSTGALFRRFGPLRDYLALQLGRPVVIMTARNFPVFIKRTSQRQYDIVITAPHLAVRANDEGFYKIRASLNKALFGVYVVRRDSKLTSPKQFANKKIATPPPQAIITAAGKLDLKQVYGVEGKLSPVFIAKRSHNAAYQAVLGGEAEGAIVSINAVNVALKKGIPLKVLAKTRPLPNMAILISGKIPATLADRIARIIVLMDGNVRGRAVLKKMHFPGYHSAGIKDYQVLRPYLKLLKKPAKK
jgi:phosphonate transport system substrate-binding protein